MALPGFRGREVGVARLRSMECGLEGDGKSGFEGDGLQAVRNDCPTIAALAAEGLRRDLIGTSLAIRTARRILLLTCSLAALSLLFPPLSFPQSVQESTPPPNTQLSGIPDGSASAADLERQGDQLRAQKRYLDSIDFYNVALK